VTPIADEFERVHEEFAKALLTCRTKADSKAVHRLRKMTRITEALLRKATEDHPGAGELHKRAKNALKELKRIRRATGPVRDLDVQKKIAKAMRDSVLTSTMPKDRQLLMREHASLDARLSRRRGNSQKELRQLLASHELKLEGALEMTGHAMRALHARGPGVLVTAKQWVRRIPLPGNDTESLHDYRKKTKAARYLAGMDEDSAAARKLAKRLKQMQDAIGEWHDLLLLAEEAKDALGGKAALTLAVKQAREQARMRAERKIRLNG